MTADAVASSPAPAPRPRPPSTNRPMSGLSLAEQIAQKARERQARVTNLTPQAPQAPPSTNRPLSSLSSIDEIAQKARERQARVEKGEPRKLIMEPEKTTPSTESNNDLIRKNMSERRPSIETDEDDNKTWDEESLEYANKMKAEAEKKRKEEERQAELEKKKKEAEKAQKQREAEADQKKAEEKKAIISYNTESKESKDPFLKVLKLLKEENKTPPNNLNDMTNMAKKIDIDEEKKKNQKAGTAEKFDTIGSSSSVDDSLPSAEGVPVVEAKEIPKTATATLVAKGDGRGKTGGSRLRKEDIPQLEDYVKRFHKPNKDGDIWLSHTSEEAKKELDRLMKLTGKKKIGDLKEALKRQKEKMVIDGSLQKYRNDQAKNK